MFFNSYLVSEKSASITESGGDFGSVDTFGLDEYTFLPTSIKASCNVLLSDLISSYDSLLMADFKLLIKLRIFSLSGGVIFSFNSFTCFSD